MKNIVLVGFMGTGKTAVAKRLSRRLKMRYISTDDNIETKEKRAISAIFTKDGEEYFRRVEAEAVREASGLDNVVIATGGGVVLSDENITNLKSKGVMICLNASPTDIFERTRSYANRPLLNVKDPLDKIKELLSKRVPYYKKADYQVDTSKKSLDQIVDEVIMIMEKP